MYTLASKTQLAWDGWELEKARQGHAHTGPCVTWPFVPVLALVLCSNGSRRLKQEGKVVRKE